MDARKVVVFGSGGAAKELIGYLIDNGGFEISCVVSTEQFNNPAFGQVRASISGIDAGYLMAVSDPETKKKIVSENEDRWISFIHKSAYISPHSKIGRGCILTPQTILAGDCVLKDFVYMNTNATVGHDSVLGKYSTLMPNSEVCGNVNVGEGALIGIGAYVLPNKDVGNWAKVSAGAVVRHPVGDRVTVYGDPARPRA